MLIDYEVKRSDENFDVCRFIQCFVEGYGGVFKDSEGLFNWNGQMFYSKEEVDGEIVRMLKMVNESGDINEDFIGYSKEAIEYLNK